MYLGNWNCIFASSLLSMSTPSGVVRATFFTILLGCAALWLGYTYFLGNLSTRSHAPGRVNLRQRYIDSQFAIRGIFLSTHLVLSAQKMGGGVRLKCRRRRKRRHKSSLIKYWKALSSRLWLASLRLLVFGLFRICLFDLISSEWTSGWVVFICAFIIWYWRSWYSGACPQVGGSCTLPGASSFECLWMSGDHLCDSVAHWESHAASSDLVASKGMRCGPSRTITTASSRASSTFLRFWVIGFFAISYFGITLFDYGPARYDRCSQQYSGACP